MNHFLGARKAIKMIEKTALGLWSNKTSDMSKEHLSLGLLAVNSRHNCRLHHPP
jgi:hypothetical protein